MDDKTIPPEAGDASRVLRAGPALMPEDIAAANEAIAATWTRPDAAGVAVVDGWGLRVGVERGHLVVRDGFGRQRRERRYARATHGLTRLVVVGQNGSVSLDALRWCDHLGIRVVFLGDESRPVLASTGGRRRRPPTPRPGRRR